MASQLSKERAWRDAVTDALEDNGYVSYPLPAGNADLPAIIYLSGNFTIRDLKYIVEAWQRLEEGPANG